MADLEGTKLDLEIIEDGDWFEFHGDIRVKIASSEREAHLRALRKQGNSNAKGFRAGSAISNAAADKLVDRLLIIHCCRDWENVEWNGKKVPFSTDAALELMLNPELLVLFKWFQSIALDMNDYTKRAREERAGNLPPESSGPNSTGAKKSSKSS